MVKICKLWGVQCGVDNSTPIIPRGETGSKYKGLGPSGQVNTTCSGDPCAC